MEELVFSSEEELYNRILPALRSKKKMLSRDGFKSINVEDIWKYMRDVKWKSSFGLELCDMVDDILNTNNVDISSYCIKKRKNKIELPKLK